MSNTAIFALTLGLIFVAFGIGAFIGRFARQWVDALERELTHRPLKVFAYTLVIGLVLIVGALA